MGGESELLHGGDALWAQDTRGGARHRPAGGDAALAQTATFDFTGHWTGSAQQTRKSPIAIAANFATGTAPQTFTGMFFASTGEGTTLHCTANGKQKRHDQVKTRLAPCDDGSTILLRGKLDPTAQTIKGHFLRVKHGKAKTGKFMLVKGPSPMGAFVDDPERSAP